MCLFQAPVEGFLRRDKFAWYKGFYSVVKHHSPLNGRIVLEWNFKSSLFFFRFSPRALKRYLRKENGTVSGEACEKVCDSNGVLLLF